MITAILTLYAVGGVLTMRYLLALMADIPREELPAGHLMAAMLMGLAVAIVWPVFWAWLVWDMWRE